MWKNIFDQRFPSPDAQKVYRHIARDDGNVGLVAVTGLILVRITPQADEELTGDILRILLILKNAENKMIDVGSKRRIDIMQGFLVSLAQPAHTQVKILFFHIYSLSIPSA